MADVAEIVRQQVARLFAESFGDADEIHDVQPALIRFQPGQLRRRDPDAPRDVGLAASLRFAQVPENSTIHVGVSGQSGNLCWDRDVVSSSALRSLSTPRRRGSGSGGEAHRLGHPPSNPSLRRGGQLCQLKRFLQVAILGHCCRLVKSAGAEAADLRPKPASLHGGWLDRL